MTDPDGETTEFDAVTVKQDRGMNFYAEQVQIIMAYIKALNAAEKEISALQVDDGPYPKEIVLTDRYGTDYGSLVDEIGGSWSWRPPA